MSAVILAFTRRCVPEPELPAEGTVDHGVWLLVNYFGRGNDHSEHIAHDSLVTHLTNRKVPPAIAEEAAFAWRTF